MYVALASASVNAQTPPSSTRDSSNYDTAMLPYALWVSTTQEAHDCPSAPELRRRVSERLGRDPFTKVASTKPAIYVSFTREGSVYCARITLKSADDSKDLERRFDDHATDCRRLVDAVALGVTLLLESERGANSDDVAPTPEPRETPTIPVATPPLAVIAPAPTPNAHAASVKAEKRQSRRVPAELTIGPVLSHGVVSSHGGDFGILLHGLLFPHDTFGIQWGADYFSAQTLSRNMSRYEFSQTTGFFGAVVNGRLNERLRLIPEAGLTFGVMHAAVLSANATHPGDYPFLGMRVGTSAQWRLVGPLVLGAGGQLRVPFNRQQFRAIGVSEPIWTQPRVGLTAEFSLGLRFD